jgi:hypothetical protein
MANAFDFDIDIHGARVVPAKTPLMPACLSEGEIDWNIKALKDDLDAVAVKMKAAVRLRALLAPPRQTPTCAAAGHLHATQPRRGRALKSGKFNGRRSGAPARPRGDRGYVRWQTRCGPRK